MPLKLVILRISSDAQFPIAIKAILEFAIANVALTFFETSIRTLVIPTLNNSDIACLALTFLERCIWTPIFPTLVV